jgi:hypothetical protein
MSPGVAGAPAVGGSWPRKDQKGRSSSSSSDGAEGRVGSDRGLAPAGEAAGRGVERAAGAVLVTDTRLEAHDVVGRDLERDPLLAVLGLVFAGAEPPLDEHAVPLAELLGGPLGAVAPDR